MEVCCKLGPTVPHLGAGTSTQHYMFHVIHTQAQKQLAKKQNVSCYSVGPTMLTMVIMDTRDQDDMGFDSIGTVQLLCTEIVRMQHVSSSLYPRVSSWRVRVSIQQSLCNM